MSNIKISPDEFSIAMDEILKDISKETQDVVKDAVGKAGRKGAKVLRTVSPVSSLPTSGKYRKRALNFQSVWTNERSCCS